MNAAEITDKLGLHSLRQRTWYIQATCATSGDGLYEGLEWVRRTSLSIRASQHPFLPLLRVLIYRSAQADSFYLLSFSRTSFYPSPLQLSTNLKRRT